MKVTRENLPLLFKPIALRVARIFAALNCCGYNSKQVCECCFFNQTKDCYQAIAKEINEVNNLMEVLANGVKKMD